MRRGLAIRKTEDINVAFLVKYEWRILAQSNNVSIQLVKAKYLKIIQISSK